MLHSHDQAAPGETHFCRGLLGVKQRRPLPFANICFGSGIEVRSLFGMSGYVRIAALMVTSQVCRFETFEP